MDYQPDTTQAAGLYQMALWSAANLAGMVSERLSAREPFFKRLIKKIAPARGGAKVFAHRPSNEESLPLLADAVVGSSRQTIFAVFGPPGGAAVRTEFEGSESAVWEAGIWYYPLPQNGPIAMAINFDEDHADHVEFLRLSGT